MKRTLTALLLGAGMAAAAFAGSSSISLTAPVITSWTDSGGTLHTTTGSDSLNALHNINNEISTLFGDIETTLNNGELSNFHDLTQLSAGFANANMASFDNASLLGYQTYDLFSAMVGYNIAAAVPGFTSTAVTSALNDITTKGDVYAGVSSGVAGQVGLNAGFLVPNLYLTGRLGYIPSTTIGSSTFQQSMFGIGANYTLVKQFDLLFGFMKWRGVSIGTGLNYNSVSVSDDVPVDDQTQSATFNPGTGSESIDASTTNTKVKLSIKSSSLVIPIDIMTSAQLFWFFNVGLGVGADLSASSATVGLGADSDLTVGGLSGTINSETPGKAKITATNSKGNGDFFVPRLAASFGLALGIFKLDVPISYYPTTKAVALGITGGIVW